MLGKLLYFCLTMLGGWIGWALGERFGLMTAFFLSLVGTAFGIYASHRITRSYL
jgi:hypothetical protein